eukprot:768287-Hanusia_phi.AAC.2
MSAVCTTWRKGSSLTSGDTSRCLLAVSDSMLRKLNAACWREDTTFPPKLASGKEPMPDSMENARMKMAARIMMIYVGMSKVPLPNVAPRSVLIHLFRVSVEITPANLAFAFASRMLEESRLARLASPRLVSSRAVLSPVSLSLSLSLSLSSALLCSALLSYATPLNAAK